ncbi:hypothetical protein [Acidisoma sp. C75]
MRRLGACLAALALLAAPPCLAQTASGSADPLGAADTLFQTGHFDEAATQYRGIVAKTPEDYPAVLKLGQIALLAKLEEDKAETGAGGGGTLKTVPYTVRRLSFGRVAEKNVPGLYDGPFPWEHMFGFSLAGMVGHDFFAPYAVTFDFRHMAIILTR